MDGFIYGWMDGWMDACVEREREGYMQYRERDLDVDRFLYMCN